MNYRRWSGFLFALALIALVIGFRLGDATAASGSSGVTTLVSRHSSGEQGDGASGGPAISADGRFVAFASQASNLVSGDTNNATDVFVHDRQSGTTSRVSVASDGTQGGAYGYSYGPDISANGRYVAFISHASNLVPGDTNSEPDVFVHNRESGTTNRVSIASDGTQANGAPYSLAISADGRYVAFASDASNLVPGQPNYARHIYVHDRQSGTTSRVSVASDGTQGNSDSFLPAISADGRFVAFWSNATNLDPGDTNGWGYDVFIHDRQVGTTIRIAVDLSQVIPGMVALSANGRYVSYTYYADTSDPYNDAWGAEQVVVRDMQTGATTLISDAPSPAPVESVNGEVALSADGRFVVFSSDIRPDGSYGNNDISIFDQQTGQTKAITQQEDAPSHSPVISGDGRAVAFSSWSSNLVPCDINEASDIFIYDQDGQAASVYSICGRVTTESGAPLPGVFVNTAAGYTTSDASGNYTITGVPAGTYNVGPTLAGYSFIPATRSVTVPSEDADEVDFVAYPQGAYSISGKVALDDGTPLRGVTVSVGFGHHATTDADGQYIIANLEAGTYEVDALLPGFSFAPSPVSIPPSRTVNAGLTEHNFDITFRPQPHGYRFSNSDFKREQSTDFTFQDFQRIFGIDEVCWLQYAGNCLIPNLFKFQTFIQLTGGDEEKKAYCFGMAATSLRFYEDPSWLPTGFHYAFDMNTSDARQEIADFQIKQYVQPIKGHTARERSSALPKDVLTEIQTALRDNTSLVLAMNQWNPQKRKMSGHAVVPYALEQESDSLWQVMVYDGNHPSPYETERYVLIDTSSDTWSYELAPGKIWSGNSIDHTLYTIPLSLINEPPTLNLVANGQGSDVHEDNGAEGGTNTIFLSGDGHLYIIDSQGRQLGFVGNELVSQIPEGAAVVPLEGPDVELEPIYVVPTNETYTIVVYGQAIGKSQRANTLTSVTQIGPEFLASVDNIPLQESTQDRVTVAADGSAVTYQASQPAYPDLSLVFEEETSSTQVQVEGVDVGRNQSVSLQADPATDQLVFVGAEVGNSAYDLSITVADTTAERHFRHGNIEIAAGDTHYIDYSEWHGTGLITLQIDEGSDGTIDDEYELGEVPIPHRLLLPMISSAR